MILLCKAPKDYDTYDNVVGKAATRKFAYLPTEIPTKTKILNFSGNHIDLIWWGYYYEISFKYVMTRKTGIRKMRDGILCFKPVLRSYDFFVLDDCLLNEITPLINECIESRDFREAYD